MTKNVWSLHLTKKGNPKGFCGCWYWQLSIEDVKDNTVGCTPHPVTQKVVKQDNQDSLCPKTGAKIRLKRINTFHSYLVLSNHQNGKFETSPIVIEISVVKSWFKSTITSFMIRGAYAAGRERKRFYLRISRLPFPMWTKPGAQSSFLFFSLLCLPTWPVLWLLPAKKEKN